MSSFILLIGIGNEFRADDGAGLFVTRRLKERNLSNITIIEQSGEGTALMETWKSNETVFLVDAASTGAVPGTIFRIDVSEQSVKTKFFHFSSHAFGVAEAVELARTLKTLPKRLIIYAIEGRNFETGGEVTPTVSAAIETVAQEIITEITSVLNHLS